MTQAPESHALSVELPDAVDRVEAAEIVRHLAHELRQPLSTIESIAYYLDLVLPPEAPKARQQLEKLQQLVEHSNWIVSNAVHFLQAAPPAPEPVDIADLLRRTAEQQVAEPKAQYEFVVQGNLPVLHMDPGQAEHMVRNLLELYRTIGADPPVHFSGCQAGEFVYIVLSAEAPACTAETVANLFKPFSPSLPSGSGLSMASLRTIVDAHGGAIEICGDAGRLEVSVRMPAPR